jgi:lysophospholipase L1-like esterase
MIMLHVKKRWLLFPLSLLLTLLASCTPDSTFPYQTMTAPVMPDNSLQKQTQTHLPASIRLLALGDSYTIGEGVQPEERWPVMLVDRLRADGLLCDDPLIIARTGWTTDELMAAIAATEFTGPFDLVTLLIGVNNQYRGRSVDEYRTQFRQLLDQAATLAGGRPERVVVLSIPDWGVTPFAEGKDRQFIAGQIDDFNRINQAETADRVSMYIDITPISREADQDTALIAPDGLHPSAKMYARWVDLAFPKVKEAVQP